jgi:hypothetical protein
MIRVILLSLLISSIAWAGHGRNFQIEYNQSKGRYQVLMEAQQIAIQKAQARAEFFKAGQELFKKYSKLIKAKYIDDEGKFQDSYEISITDRENINKLTFGFLKSNELRGRVSAHRALTFMEENVAELSNRIKTSENPDESNNSELQILSKKLQDEKEKMEFIFETAKSAGLNINTESEVKTGTRIPASIKRSR